MKTQILLVLTYHIKKNGDYYIVLDRIGLIFDLLNSIYGNDDNYQKMEDFVYDNSTLIEIGELPQVVLNCSLNEFFEKTISYFQIS